MPTLHIDQHPGSSPNRYRIEVRTQDIPGFQPQSLTTEITFALSPQERERIRWYLEDFLQFNQDPAPKIAMRVEELMDECGASLFRAIFQNSDNLRELWGIIRPRLADTRIEVATDIAAASSIPWELIRDPSKDIRVALTAPAFVRTQRNVRASLTTQQAQAERVRILLAICRPKGGGVPPQSAGSPSRCRRSCGWIGTTQVRTKPPVRSRFTSPERAPFKPTLPRAPSNRWISRASDIRTKMGPTSRRRASATAGTCCSPARASCGSRRAGT